MEETEDDPRTAARDLESLLASLPQAPGRARLYGELIELRLRQGDFPGASRTAREGLAEQVSEGDLPSLVELAGRVRYLRRIAPVPSPAAEAALAEVEREAERRLEAACDRAGGYLKAECLRASQAHYERQGRHDEAITEVNRALELLRGRNAPLLVARLLSDRCRLESTLGRLDQAWTDCRAAEALFGEHEAFAAALEPLNTRVGTLREMGRLDEAMREAERLVAGARAHGDERRIATALETLGWTAWRLGERGVAFGAANELGVRASESGRSSHQAARLFEALGDYRAALRHHYRALRSSDPETLLGGMAGLGRTYLFLGDSARARAYGERYFDRYLAIPAPAGLPVPNLSEILLSAGLREQAIQSARLLLMQARAANEPRGVLRARGEVARVRLAGGEYEQAAAELVDLLGQYEARGLFAEKGEALLALARARIHLGATTAADSALAEARLHFETTQDRELGWRLAHLEGQLQGLRGDTAAALGAFELAIERLEAARPHLPQGELRSRWLAGRLNPYEAALRIRLENGSPADLEAAWRLAEARKSRELRERTLPRHERAPSGPSRVREALGPDQAVIEYTFVDQEAWALILTRSGLSARRLPARRAEIGDQIQALRAPLEALGRGQISVAQTTWPIDSARKLYEQLLAPLMTDLGNARTIFIIPEDELWLVPFEALVTDSVTRSRSSRDRVRVLFAEYEGHTYVIDRYTIGYLPGAEWLFGGEDGLPPARGGVLAVGDPRAPPGNPARLPVSAREARAVASLWPESLVLVGPSATEEGFVAAAPDYAILHVASHAVADPVSPSGSGLLLAAATDGSGSGFLGSLEISSLDLRARLVTLSACWTASGPIRAGEGVMALSRAFMEAGAPTVVASQWAVPEAAGEIMPSFYRHLREGTGVVESLRRAKLEFRSTRTEASPGVLVSRAHPLYWAPFVVIGRPSVQPPRSGDRARR